MQWYTYIGVTNNKTDVKSLSFRENISGYTYLSSPATNPVGQVGKRIAIYNQDGSYYVQGGLRSDYGVRPALYQEGTFD